jgi:glycosyltransferase involved in cell wall biosynthesis
VSEWVRTELLRSFPDLDPSHVTTVHEGVAPPPPRATTESRRSGLLLFVSTLFAYKGAELFIDALSTLKAVRPDVDWRARLVGRDPTGGATSTRLRALAEGRDLAGRVELVGAVPHDQVWTEYQRAEIFVYPSQLETFGLPPLEAMAMGTPVVVSDAPPLVEIVDDAGLVVDPTDANAFATALARLLDSDGERQRLRDAGLRRVGELTWDRAAAALAEVLRHVAGRRA